MSWGSVDYHEFEEFAKRLEKEFGSAETDKFFVDCAKELAAILLQLVIPKTPVGDYSNLMPGYERDTAGTLRRGWTGGKDMGGKAYAHTLPVKKQGSDYVITVENIAKNERGEPYASYVEHGHTQEPGRFVPAIGKRLKRSWVEGQHFLKISEEELKTVASKQMEKKLEKKLREVFGD